MLFCYLGTTEFMRAMPFPEILLVVLAGLALTSAAQQAMEPLAWDATAKEYAAKPGETNVNFTFYLTNMSPTDVTINWVRTSCGCTVAKLPSLPWRLPPGASGQIDVATDLRGKFGILAKYVTVDTSHGLKMLHVKVNIPTSPGMAPAFLDSRTRNIQLAAVDRQIVFRNDCAQCHLLPAIGKTGESLYQSACAICHEAPQRATMVPDLRAPKQPPTKEYWAKWVRSGKAGSLMPAFAQTDGGPFTDEQIHSLINYLTHYFPPQASLNAAAPYNDD